MVDDYSFGIEIEMIAEPRSIHRPLRRGVYYEKLAKALEARGLKARADDPSGNYCKHPEEYEKRWLITRDGSITSSDDCIALEAVSPILYTSKDRESKIDKFWAAQGDVFHTPKQWTSCGSHVHVSPGRTQKWTDRQLRDIAVGIAAYETHIAEMLSVERRNHEFCQRNAASSSQLRAYHSDRTGWNGLLSAVKDLNRAGLISLMQADRKALWKFEPALLGGIGTIEFRGGRALRGPVRTKRWIAFAVAYINFLLEQQICTTGRFPIIHSAADLYQRFRLSAAGHDLKRYLPIDYNVLNETISSNGRARRTAYRPYHASSTSMPAEPPPAYTGSPIVANLRDVDSDEFIWLVIYGGLRFLQFVLALAVAGMYLAAIGRTRNSGGSLNAELVVAVMVAVSSAIVAVINMIVLVSAEEERKVWSLEWALDAFFWFLWLVVFGMFGAIYIPAEPANPRMLSGVWLDLVNMLL